METGGGISGVVSSRIFSNPQQLTLDASFYPLSPASVAAGPLATLEKGWEL